MRHISLAATLCLWSSVGFAKGYHPTVTVDWFSFPYVLFPIALAVVYVVCMCKNPKGTITGTLAFTVPLGVFYFSIGYFGSQLGTTYGVLIGIALGCISFKFLSRFLPKDGQ